MERDILAEIFLLGSLIAFPLLIAWRFRCAPTRRSLVSGILGGLAVGVVFNILTVVLYPEGNNDRAYFLLPLGTALILSLVRPPNLSIGFTTILVLLALASHGIHFRNATSPTHTDSPRGRRNFTRARQISAKKKGKPIPALPQIEPEWHTPVTGLSRVSYLP